MPQGLVWAPLLFIFNIIGIRFYSVIWWYNCVGIIQDNFWGGFNSNSHLVKQGWQSTNVKSPLAKMLVMTISSCLTLSETSKQSPTLLHFFSIPNRYLSDNICFPLSLQEQILVPVYHPTPSQTRLATQLTEEEQVRIAQRIGLIHHLPKGVYDPGRDGSEKKIREWVTIAYSQMNFQGTAKNLWKLLCCNGKLRLARDWMLVVPHAPARYTRWLLCQ